MGTTRPSCRRFTSSRGSAATTPWRRRIAESPRIGFWQGFHPGGARSRLRHRPSCLRRQRDQRAPRARPWSKSSFPISRRTFPAIADPRARLLNGHSSGGWSSLWLQVTYPDFFGGTWSTSPDPVDFRDFQRINIYAAGENMFRDRDGKRRPIARIGAMPALFYDRFCRMDDVIGWGGQLGSFEAVFSPLDHDGHPRKLWDRSTGAIDPEVAKAWEAYDIRLVLERNWPVLGPKLKGKLHVIMGDMDTFYLEGAVKLLKESLTELGSDAVVEIVPDRDHGTLLDTQLAERLDREMHAAVSDLDSNRPRLLVLPYQLEHRGVMPMPVLEREEYIEQAYFFHTFRERLLDGLPSQEILARIGEELLSTTKLPLAVSFLHIEMKGTGQMGPAMERINHYFTPFQAHVVSQAETDLSRFAMDQALLVLEREAKFKADGPSLPALFVFQFEALSRNRLGYTKGLAAMAATRSTPRIGSTTS